MPTGPTASQAPLSGSLHRQALTKVGGLVPTLSTTVTDFLTLGTQMPMLWPPAQANPSRFLLALNSSAFTLPFAVAYSSLLELMVHPQTLRQITRA